MRIHSRQLPAALLIVFVPTLALAQNPPKLPGSPTLEVPSIPLNTLPLEVVKSVPVAPAQTAYGDTDLQQHQGR